MWIRISTIFYKIIIEIEKNYHYTPFTLSSLSQIRTPSTTTIIPYLINSSIPPALTFIWHALVSTYPSALYTQHQTLSHLPSLSHSRHWSVPTRHRSIHSIRPYPTFPHSHTAYIGQSLPLTALYTASDPIPPSLTLTQHTLVSLYPSPLYTQHQTLSHLPSLLHSRHWSVPTPHRSIHSIRPYPTFPHSHTAYISHSLPITALYTASDPIPPSLTLTQHTLVSTYRHRSIHSIRPYPPSLTLTQHTLVSSYPSPLYTQHQTLSHLPSLSHSIHWSVPTPHRSIHSIRPYPTFPHSHTAYIGQYLPLTALYTASDPIPPFLTLTQYTLVSSYSSALYTQHQTLSHLPSLSYGMH